MKVQKTLAPTTVAWVAGVLDARASFAVRRVDRTELPQVSVSGADTDLLKRLGHLTGVRAFSTHRGFLRTGCVVHCAKQHVHVDSTSNRWSVSGAKATVVLSACLPYLMLKASLARKLIVIGLAAPSKPATWRKMADLGWPLPDNQEDLM